VLIDQLTEISPGIFLVFTISKTPGTLELRELSLALRGPNGLSVIRGCIFFAAAFIWSARLMLRLTGS